MVHQSGRIPLGPLRGGLRRDRAGERGLRGRAHLKVILETGELGTYTTCGVRHCSRLPAAPTHKNVDRKARRTRRCVQLCMLE